MKTEKCATCAEPCPMANMAHEAAKGRMYAMNEFIDLLKKVESGRLMEVVHCKDCKRYSESEPHYRIYGDGNCRTWNSYVSEKGFCYYGERKDNV